MLSEDKYFHTLSQDELWQRYCGFLDLSLDRFMEIQKELLMDQVERVAGSVLGKKIMGGQKPESMEEFRRLVPLTSYDDYEPYLSERQEEALAEKPCAWYHSSGKGGRYKWFPATHDAFVTSNRVLIAIFILASASAKGEIKIRPGFRLFAALPPPPYGSGSAVEFLLEHFSCQAIPPPQKTKGMEFQDRIRNGFEIALKDGVDILGALGSVLVKMGEGFAEQTRQTKFTTSMLHPKIITRFLKAWLHSKRERRVILPKDLWSPKGIVASGVDTSIYKKDVAYYWGSEPLDFYVSCETLFVATQAWNKKSMTFLPDVVFLEFIPYDEQLVHMDSKDYQPSTLLLNEVEEGKLYELVVTQFYGVPLLRYRTKDLINIVSLKDEETGVNLPQIRIQRRLGETINLGGLVDLDEKTIWQAIANTGIKFVDWTACKEYDQNQTFLRLYLELREEREADEIETMVDEQLKTNETDYKDVEDYLKQQPVRVTLLSPGTFQRYTEGKRKEGADLAHLKPTHINASQEVIQRLLQLSEVAERNA